MKLKMGIMIGAAFLFCLGSIGICASESDRAPLPDNIQIVSPSSDVTQNLANLSGKWSGDLTLSSDRWSATPKHVLVVEKIEGARVFIVFSQGRFTSGAAISRGSVVEHDAWWKRVTGFWNEEKGVLSANIPTTNNVIAIEYSLNDKGVLKGKGNYGRFPLTAELRKDK